MLMNMKYLSQKVSDYLFDSVEDNVELYKTGNFRELADSIGQTIDLPIKVDFTALQDLVISKEAEEDFNNSLIIWNVFSDLKPSLACENRIWTRLTHVECLEYTRQRWLRVDSNAEEKIIKDIRTHFFANTQTKYRDDNAISRLWWNAYIAKLASPGNQKEALRQILKTADIRSNFIERSRTVSRAPIAAGIVRMMLSNSWLTEKEDNYRQFMRALNMLGGGKVFEFWSQQKIDSFMGNCLLVARNNQKVNP